MIAIIGSVIGAPLTTSTWAPTQMTTTASAGTSRAAANARRYLLSPGRRVITRVRANAKVTPVESPVQPLRWKSTETIPMRNGTSVTPRIAYQNSAPSRLRRVTAMANSEASVVVRHSTAIVSRWASDSACAKMTSAYAKPMAV